MEQGTHGKYQPVPTLTVSVLRIGSQRTKISNMVSQAPFDQGVYTQQQTGVNLELVAQLRYHSTIAVSYTHLTLPTIYSV